MSIYDEHPTSLPTTLTPSDEWGLEPLMNVHELASYLGIPTSNVYDWRVHGKGPTAYRFGEHPKFALSDVRPGSPSNANPPASPGAPIGGELRCPGNG